MNIEHYLRNSSQIQEIFGSNEVEFKEISSGINEVYILQSKRSEKKALLKRYLPHFKNTPSEVLNQNRAHFEAQSMQIFAKYAAESVAKIYFEDRKNSIVVMEYIEHLSNLNRALQSAIELSLVAPKIAFAMSSTAFYTSRFNADFSERQKCLDFFLQNEMKTVSVVFIFDPLIEMFEAASQDTGHETNPIFHESRYNKKELLLKIKRLKTSFYEDSDALIHGDFKGGALLLNQEKISIIDFEFSSFAPMGYDLGALFHSFVAMSISYSVTETNQRYQNLLLENIEALWQSYQENFLRLHREQSSFEDERAVQKHLQKVLQESVGFFGVHMLSMSIALVIPDAAVVVKSKEELEYMYYKRVYAIAKIAILKHETFTSIEQFLKLVASHLR
ncbi:phosphotransferase [bacterium]|nr:phosphotransferase [bacterium]MBU1434367.1 phosphotransferase [bacterium]MBU1501945.1 phosphotransferase [bacterium]